MNVWLSEFFHVYSIYVYIHMLLSNYIEFTKNSLTDNKVHSKYIRCIHATKILVVMMHNAEILHTSTHTINIDKDF